MDIGPLDHIYDAQTDFSNRLYEIVAKMDGNVFCSPLSTHIILSLLYQGTSGETAETFAKALHLPDAQTTAEGYEEFMKRMNGMAGEKLQIANKIAIHNAYTLKEEFNLIARKDFFTEPENISFFPGNIAAAKKINDWVKKKTNNKIKDLVNSNNLNNSTRLILVNAIYFKGDWKYKFNRGDTKKEKFYVSETETVNCHMMHMSTKFDHYEDEDLEAQILRLPYVIDSFELMIILPSSRMGINELERKLQKMKLASLYDNLYDIKVNLSLPRFKIETRMELNEPLKELGLDIMFGNNADFSNMVASSEPLKVDQIIQKAFIEVNEEGTEAAAGTGGELLFFSTAKQEYDFIADHPFMFILSYDRIPLFIGKLLTI